MERVEDRAGAGAPEAAVGARGQPARLEDERRIATSIAVEEPGSRGASPNELEVDVGAVPVHVREDAPKAVAPVESRVGLDLHFRPGREEPFEHAGRLPRVALALVG